MSVEQDQQSGRKKESMFHDSYRMHAIVIPAIVRSSNHRAPLLPKEPNFLEPSRQVCWQALHCGWAPGRRFGLERKE
jgi:hypothetical protein